MAAQFEFLFVAIGQGDCCLVKCPDGNIIVIDCGSSANKWGSLDWYYEARVLLRDTEWAGGKGNKVHSLILTHPDTDHHNKVVDFFGAITWKGDFKMPSTGKTRKIENLAKIKIDNIFFSNSAEDTAPLRNYNGGNLNNCVYSGYFETNIISEVTINSTDSSKNFLKTWEKNDQFRKLKNKTMMNNKRLNILTGTADGKAWKVSIIAGNVPKGYGDTDDAASADNAQSLVTLFEIDGKKALFCGDTTFSTEDFLLEAHGDLLQNLEFIHVPHHGSEFASSWDFVNKLNPKSGVVSAGFLEHSYRLPRYDKSIQRWLQKIETHNTTTYPDHDIDYWTTVNENDKDITDNDITDKYNTWTQNGTDYSQVGCNNSKYFWYLLQPQNGVYGFYKFTKSGLFLYRETINSAFAQTSQRSQRYTLK